MLEEERVTSEPLSPSRIITKKTAVCAVSLGNEILQELVGTSINGNVDVNSNELIAAAIDTALKL